MTLTKKVLTKFEQKSSRVQYKIQTMSNIIHYLYHLKTRFNDNLDCHKSLW